MRYFYTHTDSTLLECLSERESLGKALKKVHKISPGESYSVDIFNVDTGALITHFEYP
jgi:hypothetical protein